MSDLEQSGLEVSSVNTNEISGTVYVVTSRKDGDPHSHVEGVYTDKGAAKKHKQYLADNSFREMAIAWGIHEQEIQTGFAND